MVDRAEDITFAVEIKCLIRQALPEPKPKPKANHPPGPRSRSNSSSSNSSDDADPTAHNTHIRPFVPHQPDASLQSMTDAEKHIQHSTWAAVAMALHTLPGVSATTGHRIREQNLDRGDFWRTHWIVYKANSAVPPYLSFEGGNPDRPVLDQAAEGYRAHVWVPSEVCSPKLYWRCRGAALEATRGVCEALGERFGAVANHSCEVHVHVGRHDGLFFSLRSMKNLATLLWLAEPILRSLKDPRSRNFDHTYTWSFAWRQHSRLALALDADRTSTGGGQTTEDLYTGGADDLDSFLNKLDGAGFPGGHHHMADEDRRALGAIWRASGHEELGRMLCGPDRVHRRLGFNFHSLAGEDERGRNSPRTVEFRFLEGLNDKDVVSGWVQVCLGLAELAVGGGAGAGAKENWRFRDMVVLLLDMPGTWSLDAKFAAVMRGLGLPEETYEPLLRVVRRNYPHDPGEPREIGPPVLEHY